MDQPMGVNLHSSVDIEHFYVLLSLEGRNFKVWACSRSRLNRVCLQLGNYTISRRSHVDVHLFGPSSCPSGIYKNLIPPRGVVDQFSSASVVFGLGNNVLSRR